MRFEWSEDKNQENVAKHGVSFDDAQSAFLDPNRLIFEDEKHSHAEARFFCFGKCDDEVLTVRFTLRDDIIRIFGAGFWRKGRKIYEEENRIHR